MRIFQIDSSPKGEISNSKQLTAHLVEQLRLQDPEVEVDYLDLAQANLPHIDGLFAKATYTEADQRSNEMREHLQTSDDLCARLLAADIVICGIPMHNWCYPSVFKAFIDHTTRTNLTYEYNAAGEIEGLLTRQKFVLITTRGADLSPPSPFAAMDALTPALKAAFSFIGARDMTFVDVQPLQFANQEAHQQALAEGKARLAAWAHQLR